METVLGPAGRRPPPVALRYSIAIGMALAFVGLRLLLGDFLGDRAPLIVLLLAPMLAAHIAGFGPGVLATLLAAGLGEALFVPPLGSVLPPDAGEAVRLAVFVIEGVVVSWLIETRRTALERAERDRSGLAQAQARLEAMLAAISDAFFALDREGRFRYVNAKAEALLAAERDALLGRPAWEAFTPALGTVFETELRRAVQTRQPTVFEALYPPLDSWFEVRAYPSREGLSVYFQNVNERRAMQSALEQARVRLQAIIDGAPLLIYVKDREGRYTLVNETQLRLLRVARDDVIGRADADLFPPELAATLRANDLETWSGGEPRAFEEGVEIDGSVRCFRSEKFLLRDDVGEPLGLCGMSVDVTDLRAAEAAVRRANAELESRVEQRTAELAEANAELEEFAHTVAHDLRAPLRNIQGFAAALLEDESERLSEDGRTYARRMADGAVRMDTLISDLLAYSRLARSQVRPEPVELSSVLRDVLGELGTEIGERGARIAVEPSLPAVMAHRTTLAQTLANLLGNAIKFVAPGVAPAVSVSARTTDDGWVELTVADNGIGIAPEHHERVFAVFERLHGQERYPGTGIGLAIVRKAVERMHGRLRLDSALGHGSRFVIALPAAR